MRRLKPNPMKPSLSSHVFRVFRQAPSLAISAVASLFIVAEHRVEAQVSMPLDVNGDGVADFVNTTSGSPPWGGVAAFVSPVMLSHPENAMVPLAVGEIAGAGSPWVPGAGSGVSVGYYGIRFGTAFGTHYGWLETYNPVLNGQPSFVNGGWTLRAFFNPEPNQPIEVGDTTLLLRVRMNPSTGMLNIRWNTNASAFAGGLRIERRSLQPNSPWTVVQNVGLGFEADVALSGDGGVFRVVH